jgi:uncharacterized protein (TIGR02466 family)
MELKNNKIYNHFTSPIYSSNLKEINNEKIKEFAYFKKNNNQQEIVQKSNFGGWQSKNLNKGEEKEIDKLVEIILKESLEFIKIYSLHEKYNLYFDNIWININKKGDCNVPHIHANSFISGVYYVDSNIDSGNIVFENPCQSFDYFINNIELKKGNGYNLKGVFYHPENNKLILFPSYLIHYVQPNKSLNDRISLSFNLNIKNDI